jgi:hypothetical protein
VPQSKSRIHTAHCLDAIRRDAMCISDDTPWSTGDPLSPMKQNRKCRNFDELQAWGRENSACFSYDAAENTSTTREEHFKFCPEGSPYTKSVKEYFPDIA